MCVYLGVYWIFLWSDRSGIKHIQIFPIFFAKNLWKNNFKKKYCKKIRQKNIFFSRNIGLKTSNLKTPACMGVTSGVKACNRDVLCAMYGEQ